MPLSPDELLSLNYPFGGAAGRNQSRLLFDLAVGLSCFDESIPNRKVLDFACGTGWTSEWLNRFGYDVHAFDIDPAAIHMANLRPPLDQRIDPARFHTSVGDGHGTGFGDATFGHVFCFDSLHHMKDYRSVLVEMNRVLVPGGRAIFIEPGSRHSKSEETIRFLKEHKFGDWWLEKDVDLVEINDLAKATGFSPLRVKPFLLPVLVDFSLSDWYNILENPAGIRNYMTELRRFTYEDRVLFYLVKPAGG
jgi:SAM-dependent methyltransferase